MVEPLNTTVRKSALGRAWRFLCEGAFSSPSRFLMPVCIVRNPEGIGPTILGASRTWKRPLRFETQIDSCSHASRSHITDCLDRGGISEGVLHFSRHIAFVDCRRIKGSPLPGPERSHYSGSRRNVYHWPAAKQPIPHGRGSSELPQDYVAGRIPAYLPRPAQKAA